MTFPRTPPFADAVDNLGAATFNSLEERAKAYVDEKTAASAGLVPTPVKTGNYTASGGDSVRVNATAGTITVTLPASAVAGTVVEVKKTDGVMANPVSIVPSGGDTIDILYMSVGITQPNIARTFRKDSAANWVVTGGLNPITGPGGSRYDRAHSVYLPSDTCLTYLKRGMARGRTAGGAAARVLTRGDSTTAGVISGLNPEGLTEPRKYVWIDMARQVLNASQILGGPCGESISGVGSDSRFTPGGFTNGPPITCAAGAEPAKFVDDGEHDAFDFVVMPLSNATTFKVTIDAGEAKTVTMGQGNNVGATFRVTAPTLGVHTVTISAPNTGTLYLFALEPVNTKNPPPVKLQRVGYSGQLLVSGLNPAITTAGSSMAYLLQQSPDAIILLMGVNDMRTQTLTAEHVAAYQTALTQFAEAFKGINCDPIFMVFPSYNSNQQTPGTYEGISYPGAYESLLFQQAIYAVADAQNVAVLDLQRRWGYGSGMTGNTGMYDGTHYTLAGNYDAGRMIANFLGSI